MAFAAFATGYSGEPRRPSGGPQPGAVALDDYICTESPWAAEFTSLGIYAARDVCGNWWPDVVCTLSQHARGAAGDEGCRVVRPGGLATAWEVCDWLVANYAVLGLQELIFARLRWTNQTLRWEHYGGLSDHFDHIHFALNSSGARYLTRDRILSVAPDVQEDIMPALTDAEQRLLLANSKATLLLATAANTAAAKTAPVLIRRKGSRGMSTVAVQFGIFRVPLTAQSQADAWKAELGQNLAKSVTWPLYDSLVNVADVDELAALIRAGG